MTFCDLGPSLAITTKARNSWKQNAHNYLMIVCHLNMFQNLLANMKEHDITLSSKIITFAADCQKDHDHYNNHHLSLSTKSP